jgi:sugar phosphate permease
LIVLLIDKLGWRVAMLDIGVCMWLICLPLSLLIRPSPESYTYLPAREEDSTVHENANLTQRSEANVSAREVLKNRSFWHIVLALMSQSMVVNAMVTHVMPFLSSVNINRSASSLMASILPVVSIFGRLSFGWLGDRFQKRRIAATGFALTSFGLLLFSYVSNEGMWLLVFSIVIFSTGWGGNVTMRAALIREYFGKKRFGTIHGFAMGIMTLGTIVGAPFAGWIYDEWHNYRIAWFVFAAFSAIAAFIILATPLSAHNKNAE